MERIEQEVKKRLSQSRTLDGIDSNAIWETVSSSSRQKISRRHKKRVTIVWLVLALFSVMTLISYLVVSIKSSIALEMTARSIEVSEKVLETRKKEKEHLNYSEDLQTRHVGEKAIDSKTEVENELDTVKLGSKQINSVHLSVLESSEVFNSLKPHARKETAAAGRFSEPKKELYNSGNELRGNDNFFNRDIGTLNSTGGMGQIDSNLVRGVSNLYYLHPLPPQKLVSHSNTEFFPVIERKFISSFSEEKPITWRYHNGLIFLHNKFTGEKQSLADSLMYNLSSDLGYSVAGSVKIKQDKYYLIYLGLEYMRWNERFDKIIVSNEFIQLNEDSVTGRSIRTIKHHNVADILSFPLEIGIYKDFWGLRFGALAGVSYSVVLMQNGRFLNNESTVIYYSQKQKRYSNFFSLRFTPSISYKLNEKIMLDFNCPLSIQKHKPNEMNNLTGLSFFAIPAIGLTVNY